MAVDVEDPEIQVQTHQSMSIINLIDITYLCTYHLAISSGHAEVEPSACFQDYVAASDKAYSEVHQQEAAATVLMARK